MLTLTNNKLIHIINIILYIIYNKNNFVLFSSLMKAFLSYEQFAQQSIQTAPFLFASSSISSRGQINTQIQSQRSFNEALKISFNQITNLQKQIKNQNNQSGSDNPNKYFNANQRYQAPFVYIGLIISCITLDNYEQHYGTGTIIHNNLVITTAQNVFCHKLNKQYTKIQFIKFISNENTKQIYDVKRIYYPNQYTSISENFTMYNFCILELYENVNTKYGNIGLKFSHHQLQQQISLCGYTTSKKQKQAHLFKLIIKEWKMTSNFYHYQTNNQYLLSGSPIISRDSKNSYFLIGMHMRQNQYSGIHLSNQTNNILNKFIKNTEINLDHLMLKSGYRDIGLLVLKEFKKFDYKFDHLSKVNLWNNNIGNEGCKQFQNINWPYLTNINLGRNNIRIQGSKYLSICNWKCLNTIDLSQNNLQSASCQYLAKAHWPYLINLNLSKNYIRSNGCKFLKDANWMHLNTLNLNSNHIDEKGCKYIIQSRWVDLINLKLSQNNIKCEGCKHLKDSNWPNLITLNLCKIMILLYQSKILNILVSASIYENSIFSTLRRCS